MNSTRKHEGIHGRIDTNAKVIVWVTMTEHLDTVDGRRGGGLQSNTEVGDCKRGVGVYMNRRSFKERYVNTTSI